MISVYRLLTKLGTVVDRTELNLDTAWAETGDRYMLKLFRDYVFHQVMEDGLASEAFRSERCGSPTAPGWLRGRRARRPK